MKYNWPFPTLLSQTFNNIKETFSSNENLVSEISEVNEPVTLTATKERIKFIHFDEGNVVCTVAYRPCNFTKGLKMLEVAAAYKHPKDQYNKKIGARTAAQRFLEGRTICMPLRGKTNQETYWNLHHAFVVAATDCE